MTLMKSPQLSEHDLAEEQHLAIDRLYETDETLLIAGLGFGKAIVGLTAVDQLVTDGLLRGVLILAPLAVATLTWAEEAGGKWSHIKNPVAIACGTPRKRDEAMASGARIVVTNFENLDWMLKYYGDRFDGLLIDEISKVKAAGGALTKALRRWAPGLKWRAGMSATPIAECADDIYAQALVLDNGKALGTRKSVFLERYFDKADYLGYSYAPKPGALAELAERLADLVFTAADSGYRDSLPGVVTDVRRCAFEPAGAVAYRAMDRKGVFGEVVAINAAVRKGKLQQIAAGGLYASEGEKVLAWHGFHKMTALAETVWELAEAGEPVVIVYTYLFELEALRQAYPAAPVLGGGSRLTREQLAAFNAGEIPVLLMHWRSGGHGLNLQGACRTMIHLTPLWSADGWSQTIGRIHRRGQTRRCHRIVLVTGETVEEEMMQRVAGKAESEAEFMRALA